MSSAKVEKLKLVAQKSAEKAFTVRDVVILCLSFSFTIIVACLILFFISENQQKSSVEIKEIVERILEARNLKSVKSDSKSYERKRGYLDDVQDEDSPRKKRAIHDARSTLNGEFQNKAKRSTTQKLLIRSRAADHRVFQSGS